MGDGVSKQLRGRVVIREIKAEARSFLWTPAPDKYHERTHRGRVLAKGAPALRTFHYWNGSEWVFKQVEVPHGFEVGDVVIYHFTHLQENATRSWDDGEPATWVPQENVDGVIEEEPN